MPQPGCKRVARSTHKNTRRVASIGGIVIGTPIGGLLARAYGITAPFWFAFFGSALLVTLLWRQFANIVAASAVDEPGEPQASRSTG